MIGGQSVVFLLLAFGLASAEIRNVGWWNSSVFYQIYPRSYMDSNADGNGDLNGITSKLDHIVDSGIDGIWLSPIYTSPLVDMGYDIADFQDIDSMYGGIEALKTLVKEAHKKKLKVILDLVPNHSSDDHWWFTKSLKSEGKYTDYYIWAEGKDGKTGKVPPNDWKSVFGGPAWTFNGTRGAWYYHQFDPRQPDLNYRNENVRKEMENVIRFWLENGIDGFRVDAVPHLIETKDLTAVEPLLDRSNCKAGSDDYECYDHIFTKDQPELYDLIQSWRYVMDNHSHIHNEDEKIMMTEAYTNMSNTMKYYEVGSQIPFNFNFITNRPTTAKDFKTIIDTWMKEKPKGRVANWVMGNHDNNRTASRYPGRADQMNMLTMVLPGVAITYNGEEIGMEDNDEITFEQMKDPQVHVKEDMPKSRDFCRSPFQWDNTANAGFSKNETTWLPVAKNYKELNQKAQLNVVSHLSVYKNLTALRRTSHALKTGVLSTTLLADEKVLDVTRKADNESMTLLINFDEKTDVTVDLSKSLAGKSYLILTNVGAGLDLSTTNEIQKDKILVPKKSTVLIYTNDGGFSLMNGAPFTFVLSLVAMLLFRS